MSHVHSITRCDKCDIVISQCRCMRQDKLITYETCDTCKLAASTTTVPNIRQELREAKAREVYLRYQLSQLTLQIEELEKNDER